MDDRAALLAAVCDRPDDDTPRLVYADYLDDHGDPDYARFIRAQVELARVPEWDRRWLHAWHHDRELITGQSFRNRFPPSMSWNSGQFRRGFPWNVQYPTPERFVERADEAFASAPFQSLTLYSTYQGPPPDLRHLADHPRVLRLRRLSLVRTRLDTIPLLIGVDRPHFDGLTDMNFEHDAVTTDAAANFLTSGVVDLLTGLRFHSIPLPATYLRLNRGRAALRRLTITDAGLAGASVATVFAFDLFHGLAELDLSGNELGPAGVAGLAASPAAATLESLTLAQTAPGVPGVRALADQPALANLRRLRLPGCRLGPVAAQALADSPHLRNLAVLDLAGNEVGNRGAFALAASPHLRNLAELNLTGTGLTDRGVAALLDSPVTAGLVRLGVSGNLSAEMVARVRERFGG